jgi:cell division protein FtsQ
MSNDQVERTRKRFVRRQRSRRWLRWRAVVIIAASIVFVITCFWLGYFSPVFSVQSVEVQGIQLLTSEKIRATAQVPDGEALARVDLDQIEKRLLALAEVKDAEVTREWPHTIILRLTERTAVAVVRAGAGFHGVDAEGVLFRRFATQPPKLPLITTALDLDQDAMKECAAVVALLPVVLQRAIDHVEVESIDRISLFLRDKREVQWGSATKSVDKARVLAALLKAVPQASQYDVSSPGHPTTRS